MFSKSKLMQVIRTAKTLRTFLHTDNSSLILLHTIFRHGDRTPDLSSSYPNDPYRDHDYSPYGHGQLTNAGKRRAYNLGEFFRLRYGSFLGNVYMPEYIDAWASEFDRTKMTLQLVLASLYPPKDHQIWHDEVKWQPIPYTCPPRDRDNIFLAFMHNRDALEEYYKQVDINGGRLLKPYEDTIKFVEKKCNIEVQNPRSMFAIACTLATQEALGLQLPEWTKNVWPSHIEEIAMKEFDILVSSANLKSLVIGKLFKKIIDDTQLKIAGSSKCKIHMYSGHDFTVGLFLRVLNVFHTHHPDFCATIVLEVHKIHDIYGFKIVYKSKESDFPKELIIPGLSNSFCPFDKFRELINDILTNKFVSN